jgi:hypothetical protein
MYPNGNQSKKRKKYLIIKKNFDIIYIESKKERKEKWII